MKELSTPDSIVNYALVANLRLRNFVKYSERTCRPFTLLKNLSAQMAYDFELCRNRINNI